MASQSWTYYTLPANSLGVCVYHISHRRYSAHDAKNNLLHTMIKTSEINGMSGKKMKNENR